MDIDKLKKILFSNYHDLNSKEKIQNIKLRLIICCILPIIFCLIIFLLSGFSIYFFVCCFFSMFIMAFMFKYLTSLFTSEYFRYHANSDISPFILLIIGFIMLIISWFI